MMKIEDLKSKKIAIAGLGVNNRKMAEYFGNHGVVFEAIENWSKPLDLLGKLESFDVVFRTPGLPYKSQPIQQAKNAGVIILSQTKLFFDLCPSPIIGVTGTKGKGTTASLIAKILSASAQGYGGSAGKKVFLAGNIGRDPFEFLDELTANDWVVMELSSFQLQDMEQSPHIAVVLNITPDHLNHHETIEEYIQAKSQIIGFQKRTDYAVLDKRLPEWFGNLGKSKKIFFDPGEARAYRTKLLGIHNLDNIAAAVAVAKILEIPESQIQTAVAQLDPLPHRLNILGAFAGVTFIDDAFSTNIDPTIAAIDAIKAPLILCVGGFDKGLDFTTLGQKIKKFHNLKALVVFGQVTDKILTAVEGFSGKILIGAKTMPEIISQAQSLSEVGDTILFSPGTASFDMFKNEQDRGEQFVKEVGKLKR